MFKIIDGFFVLALKLSPRHPEVLKLVQEIGYRRRPVIPFLARSNPINIWLGRMRYEMQQRKELD